VIAPNGRYAAYSSNIGGRFEVYVRPFPDGRGRWQVSQNGGEAPAWGPDGQELFFKEGDTLMRVVVSTAVVSPRVSRASLRPSDSSHRPWSDCAIRCQPRRPEILDGRIRANPCRALLFDSSRTGFQSSDASHASPRRKRQAPPLSPPHVLLRHATSSMTSDPTRRAPQRRSGLGLPIRGNRRAFALMHAP
jgi:hypothetical protein